jgi:hypothetical protein
MGLAEGIFPFTFYVSLLLNMPTFIYLLAEKIYDEETDDELYIFKKKYTSLNEISADWCIKYKKISKFITGELIDPTKTRGLWFEFLSKYTILKIFPTQIHHHENNIKNVYIQYLLHLMKPEEDIKQYNKEFNQEREEFLEYYHAPVNE